jgi:hypothetical protein
MYICCFKYLSSFCKFIITLKRLKYWPVPSCRRWPKLGWTSGLDLMPQVLKILNNNLLNLTDHRESSFSFLPFKILILLLRYNYMMLTCKVKFSNTFTLYGVQNQFLRFDYVTCKSSECSYAIGNVERPVRLFKGDVK